MKMSKPEILQRIPTVTEKDLADFHNKHFGTSTKPSEPFISQRLQDNEFDEEDDDLGYYPDGVKRTLTDEQIAMFRHSEIQSLLREKRRLQADAEEADLDRQRQATSSELEAETPAQEASLDEAFPKRHRKRKAQVSLEHQRNNPTSNMTHRRIAREKDELPEANVELDY